ncbi:MAG: DUF4238 domain-containing protein [Lachnospiraceae bacterium]|nr:DUF4238 domain-containing protein [Lachnospiraceae bacterium]
MSETKKQHHVPRSYLRNFAKQEGKECRLYMQMKGNVAVHRVIVDNVAAARNFYTIELIENKYIWEEYYATVIEPKMSETLRTLILNGMNCLVQTGSIILTDEIKVKMAMYMIVQLLRSRNTRSYEEGLRANLEQKTIEQAKKIFSDMGMERAIKLIENYHVSDDLFKLTIMEATLNVEQIEKYMEVLLEKIWVVYRIDGDAEFITSDNPVMFMNRETLDVTPFKNGLKQNTTMIYYPISPRLLLALYSDRTMGGTITKFQDQLLYINAKKDKRFIDNHNKKQKEQCDLQVFCYTEKILQDLN